ncbi:MAG: ribosomal protein S18-alanine N-acetyltransferase [Eubacteriales bacterium]|nr:ribosomal protein S18-alanine N-acetyltransferase [Eubacteriales bacterium]
MAQNASVFVRAMTPDDVPAVADIERQCFDSPWSADAFYAELGGNRCARYLVLTCDGRVAAYGGMWLILDQAHVNNIAVAPGYRGCGYGRRLMKALMRVAYRDAGITEITLEVRTTNTPALRLYESLGFAAEGRRKNYYEDGADAYIMWCRDTLGHLIDDA